MPRIRKGDEESEQYRATRDRELWYLKADKGKTQACIYAQGGLFRGKRVVYCLPAVWGDTILLKFIEESLRPLVVHPTKEGWLTDEVKFRALAEKAPGITPSWYNRRPGMNARYADPETCEITAANTKFLKRAANKAGLPDPHLMKTMFGWLQQQMLEDLILHHEPIDLGFAWLIAMPYRPNWKDALSRDADFDLETLRKNRAAIYRRLTSLTLAGIKPVGKDPANEDTSLYGFHWTLEVIPKSVWHRSSAEVELKTRVQGSEAHIRNWGRIIWDLRPKIQQALEEHALACKLPVGTVRTGITPKDAELRPYAGSELVTRNGTDSPDPIVWGDGAPPVWGPGGEALPTERVRRKYTEPVGPLDIGIPRAKNLISIVQPDALDGYPSGNQVAETKVSEPDPVPIADGSGAKADMDEPDPYPWSDDPT